MTIYFSEKFKQLRKNLDFTQEQIADIFHVSPQSVSRWENGANYPDIDLLPHIAIFFKVTIDELLGTETIKGEEKITEYIKDIRNLLNCGKVNEALDLTRCALKEYPLNKKIQFYLIEVLCTACSNKSNFSKIEIDNFKNEVIDIGNIIINTTNPSECLEHKFELIRNYSLWGMKEEAARIVSTLPAEAYYTQDLTLKYVLEGEKLQHYQKLSISRFTIILCDFIKQYTHANNLNVMQKIECLKIAMQIENMTISIHGNTEGIHINNAFQNIILAELYCEANDIQNALDYIEKAVQDSMYHIDKMNLTNENDGSNYYPWSNPRNLCWILWEDFLLKKEFDILRNNERFIKYFERLKEYSNNLK